MSTRNKGLNEQIPEQFVGIFTTSPPTMELSEDSEKRGQEVGKCFTSTENTSQDIVRLYDAFVKYYEKDVGYWADRSGKFVEEFIEFTRVNKEDKILDVAAGTGFVGRQLKQRGFTNVDALDGSIGMLDRARDQGIYQNYMHVVIDANPIQGIEENSYDALISFGAIKRNHLNTDCLEPLVTITKPGGHIFLLSAIEWIEDIREEFEDKIRQLQNEGRLRWVLMKESPDPYFESENPLLYAFKVLK